MYQPFLEKTGGFYRLQSLESDRSDLKIFASDTFRLAKSYKYGRGQSGAKMARGS